MTEEERAEEDRLDEAHPRPRWSVVGVVVCILLAVASVGSVAAAVYSRSGAATSEDVRVAQELAQTARERTDCRSEYNSRITELKDQRLAYISDVVVASTLGDTARVGALARELATLNTKIEALPKRLDIAVEQGFTLDGVHYSPCPG